MTWFSKVTTGFGLILLVHACYSAHEHSALQSVTAASLSLSSLQAAPTVSLPVDISIETIVAIFAVCLGLVLGTPELRPIQWRLWAGKIEREGEAGFTNIDGQVDKDYVGNPYKVLETRPGFTNIRKQRQEFADWIRDGGGSATSIKL